MPPENDTEVLGLEESTENLEGIEETTATSTLPEDTTSTEEVVDYKALYEQRDREYQDFQESIRPIQEYQRAQEQAQLEELEQGLLSEIFGGGNGEQEEGSGGAPKLDAKKREAVQNLLRGGIQYYQQREMIQKNMLAGTAISMAEEILGSKATIGQLKEVARELAGYGNEQVMRSAIPVLKQKYRTSAAEERLATGADSVQAANPQPGLLNDFKALERAWVDDKIQPGSAQEKRYFEMRAARGL